MASNKEGHVSAYFPQFLDAFPIAFVTIQKQVFKVGSDAYITKLYSNFWHQVDVFPPTMYFYSQY